MIDVSKIKYLLYLVTETGAQLNITAAVKELGWGEGDGELAARINCALYNTPYNGAALSSAVKLNCKLVVIADCGAVSAEVCRGTIVVWAPTCDGNSGSSLECTAYDVLYDMQQSEDNRYYPDGTGTQSALFGVFDDWGIPVASYDGPDVPHAKTVFKSKKLGDIAAALLDDAVKKGAPKCIIRAVQDKVSVLPRGSNADIYMFCADNMTVASDEISTEDMVTRVKVMGVEDDDGRTSVEAVVNGQTQYGIRQKIVSQSSSDTLEDSKTEAQSILDKDGAPKRTSKVTSPDVPFVRKGDKVHISAGTLDGYFYVTSIQHNATDKKMTMAVEPV